MFIENFIKKKNVLLEKKLRCMDMLRINSVICIQVGINDDKFVEKGKNCKHIADGGNYSYTSH